MNRLFRFIFLFPMLAIAAEGDVPIEQADGMIRTQTISGDVSITASGVVSVSNAAEADSLSANGANCATGSYPLGVDAVGAAEGCTDATTEITAAISAASSSYATAAQGALADSALQPADLASGTITPASGDLDLSGATAGQSLVSDGSGNWAPGDASGASADLAAITGYVLSVVDDDTIEATPGTLTTESGATITSAAALTDDLTAAAGNTYYHCYVSAGPTLACNSTAPAAPYLRTARSLPTDNGSRYVGSLRTNPTGDITRVISTGTCAAVDVVFTGQAASGDGRRIVSGHGAETGVIDLVDEDYAPPTASHVLLQVLMGGATASWDMYAGLGDCQNGNPAESIVADATTCGLTVRLQGAAGKYAYMPGTLIPLPASGEMGFGAYRNESNPMMFVDLLGVRVVR